MKSIFLAVTLVLAFDSYAVVKYMKADLSSMSLQDVVSEVGVVPGEAHHINICKRMKKGCTRYPYDYDSGPVFGSETEEERLARELQNLNNRNDWLKQTFKTKQEIADNKEIYEIKKQEALLNAKMDDLKKHNNVMTYLAGGDVPEALAEQYKDDGLMPLDKINEIVEDDQQYLALLKARKAKGKKVSRDSMREAKKDLKKSSKKLDQANDALKKASTAYQNALDAAGITETDMDKVAAAIADHKQKLTARLNDIKGKDRLDKNDIVNGFDIVDDAAELTDTQKKLSYKVKELKKNDKLGDLLGRKLDKLNFGMKLNDKDREYLEDQINKELEGTVIDSFFDSKLEEDSTCRKLQNACNFVVDNTSLSSSGRQIKKQLDKQVAEEKKGSNGKSATKN